MMRDDDDDRADADGRPDVFSLPLEPRLKALPLQRRSLRPPSHDRLLRALWREHGRPRFDLPSGFEP